MQIIKSVATNIITGALGVGKTTLIKQILNAKPVNERWAVLVNEFGEVGIDGALITSASNKQSVKDQGVFVREIPGGCMCCVSGLPLQIALNQLLSLAKPHRLLIEPTGLGHPKELVEVLSSQHYRDVITLNTTLCLTDARKLANPKWRAHKTFREQFQIADIIIATKHDLYSDHDYDQLNRYLKEISIDHVPVLNADKNKTNFDLLDILSQTSKNMTNNTTHGLPVSLRQNGNTIPQTPTEQFPLDDVVRKTNAGEGFYSYGLIWPANCCFNHSELLRVLSTISVIRIKALMITNEGIFGFNGQANELDVNEYDEALDSRLEIIADSESAANIAATAIEATITVSAM